MCQRQNKDVRWVGRDIWRCLLSSSAKVICGGNRFPVHRVGSLMHSPGFRSGVQRGMINGASSNNIENIGGKNPLNLEWVVHQTFIDQATDINSNKLENCLVFVRYLWRLTQFFLWRLWSLHFFSLADCMGPANRGSVSRGLRSLCCDAGLRDEGKSGADEGLCQSLCFVFDISNSFSNAFFLSPLNSLNKRGGMLMMLEGQNYFPGN